MRHPCTRMLRRTTIFQGSVWASRTGLLALVALSFSVGCKSTDRSSSDETFVAQARMLTDAFQKQLKSELVQAMQSGGPSAAIEVCHERAPQIADEVREREDKSSWTMKRTALRVRNPKNEPTDWQRRGLAVLQRKLSASGGRPDSASAPETPVEWHDRAEDGRLRYLRAIPMAPLCTTCHGDEKSLPPIVKQKLAQFYPQDQATGFSVGDLRGAFVVTAPQD